MVSWVIQIPSPVRTTVSMGWIEAVRAEMRLYTNNTRMNLLYTGWMWTERQQSCYPRAGRAPVLDLLHDGHSGITQMKSIVRRIVLWPNLILIQTSLRRSRIPPCIPCQVNRKDPASVPSYIWDWPEKPWAQVQSSLMHIQSEAKPFRYHPHQQQRQHKS